MYHVASYEIQFHNSGESSGLRPGVDTCSLTTDGENNTGFVDAPFRLGSVLWRLRQDLLEPLWARPPVAATATSSR
jgi:hypothetical protein